MLNIVDKYEEAVRILPIKKYTVIFRNKVPICTLHFVTFFPHKFLKFSLYKNSYKKQKQRDILKAF
ncbi:MAG: hypothetical protein EAZ77_14665 [Nostocales cyanobacterium]|nr:MAG: hypothetical protein EAZ77_14665 [Nostocales cyanobacterium]